VGGLIHHGHAPMIAAGRRCGRRARWRAC
jgi:hypothetical protein